jgi:hydrogenase maturation protease
VTLIIGYGNPLRRDDSVGQRLAQMMEVRLGAAAQVITAYQLTPELVEPIAQHQWAVFIDARVGEPAGQLMLEGVLPEVGTAAFSHHASPAALLGAAEALYGQQPQGILLTITGADFAFGSELSSELAQRLPDLANQVEAIISNQLR